MTHSSTSPPIIWVLTDDRAGNVAQATGVAEALGMPFVTKEICYTPLARLPNVITGARLIGLTPESRTGLTPPWPDLVIAAGRRTAPVARWIKRNAQKPVALAQLMNPGRRGADEFDLIAVPQHDCALPNGDAANVLRTTGAAHRLTPARLAAAGEAWGPRLSGLPKPHIAVLVGGATHSRPFPTGLAAELGRRVQALARGAGGTVLLASSRRTGTAAEAALTGAISEPRQVFLWSAGGDNPYTGYLALADAIIVTGDSVSMCTEACAVGRPVYIYAPDGMVAAKHARLHQRLYELGLARPLPETFDAGFAAWHHEPLNPTGEIARAVRALLNPSS